LSFSALEQRRRPKHDVAGFPNDFNDLSGRAMALIGVVRQNVIQADHDLSGCGSIANFDARGIDDRH
jgi:hypothetical protein